MYPLWLCSAPGSTYTSIQILITVMSYFTTAGRISNDFLFPFSDKITCVVHYYFFFAESV